MSPSPDRSVRARGRGNAVYRARARIHGHVYAFIRAYVHAVQACATGFEWSAVWSEGCGEHAAQRNETQGSRCSVAAEHESRVPHSETFVSS